MASTSTSPFNSAAGAAPRATLAGLVDEMLGWMARAIERNRAKRDYPALARDEVTADIAAEVAAATEELSRDGHAAEIHDLEALAVLDQVMADGVVTAEELPALRHVRALVARSAALDHGIVEKTARETPAPL